MKSRVINSKHMIEHKNGYTGYTSRLKPSLFYGNPQEENVIWLQDSHTNKMAKFILDEVIGEEKGMIWIYKPTQKFLDKFPHLEDKTIKIHFDLWQTHPFAIKKRAGLVKKKGWKNVELLPMSMVSMVSIMSITSMVSTTTIIIVVRTTITITLQRRRLP